MDIAWYVYPLAILAGIVAGIINTLAGSGSLVTIPMLIYLGLPSNVANTTNRVGVLLQNVVGITTFWRSGKFDMSGGMWLLAPAIPGAFVGAWMATQLGRQQMDIILAVVMIVMLFVIIFDAERWLREQSQVRPGRPSWWTLLLFFGVGVYGAFIQVSVGVIILAAMVLGTGYSLIHANAIKLMIVLVVTAIALAIFAGSGLIDWYLGGLMAVGQSIGAWLAVRFATRARNANIWVRRLLITVVVVSIVDLLGILDWITGLVAG
ncbi:MAG: sulfite exporter TauE/SafE family protein [Chloroflexi bacterium]|nr:MAG: sulfite exporter TauE/SafE family protein [Chloroflexota bacterium]